MSVKDKQIDEVLERLLRFIPEIAKEIEIREDKVWISRKGVEIFRKKVDKQLLLKIFGIDC